MIVKIIKCSDSDYWYRDRIGETFTVYDYGNKKFYGCPKEDSFINLEDCEVIIEKIIKEIIDLSKVIKTETIGKYQRFVLDDGKVFVMVSDYEFII